MYQMYLFTLPVLRSFLKCASMTVQYPLSTPSTGGGHFVNQDCGLLLPSIA